MPGKRLFWFAIIVVELVFVYVLWKPVSAHFRSPRRAAVNSAASQRPRKPQAESRASQTRPPEISEPAIAAAPIPILPAKPSGAITHSAPAPRLGQVVVNAGLKTPEPIPAKPDSAPPPSPLADSFWCHISKVEAACDCQRDGEQTANLVLRSHRPEAVPAP